MEKMTVASDMDAAYVDVLSAYQRRCIRERLAEGYEIVGYGRVDGDWATLVLRRGTYENRVAFPRSRAIERYYSAYPSDGAA